MSRVARYRVGYVAVLAAFKDSCFAICSEGAESWTPATHPQRSGTWRSP